MRRYSVLLLAMLLTATAQGSESSASSSPSKPIKSAASKEESGSGSSASEHKDKEKDSRKSEKSSKDSKDSKEKDSKDKDAKEAMAAEELATRIAERLAVLKKEKDDSSKSIARAPIVRSPYAPRAAVKPKPAEGGERGAAAMAAAMAGSTPAAAAALPLAQNWAYQGDGGPANWGKMSPANRQCDSGERQSPIDIRDGIKVDLDPIVFDYKASAINVLDNSHTIQVNPGSGNYISVLGHSYELQEFHFHRPSPERINGRAFEMAIHLVHKDADGKIAVIAIMIERGKPHPVVQQVWNNLPLEKNQPQTAMQPMDLINLLPSQHGYYTYMGSLEHPPCSEGVLWMVMKDPVELSADQIAIFSRLYPMNARPVQKAAGRLIKESN